MVSLSVYFMSESLVCYVAKFVFIMKKSAYENMIFREFAVVSPNKFDVTKFRKRFGYVKSVGFASRTHIFRVSAWCAAVTRTLVI